MVETVMFTSGCPWLKTKHWRFHLQHVSGISIKFENMKRNLVKIAIVQWNGRTDGWEKKGGKVTHHCLLDHHRTEWWSECNEMWSLGKPQHFFAICTEAKVNVDHLPKSDILLETYSLWGQKNKQYVHH